MALRTASSGRNVAELDRSEREVHHDEHDVDERDRRLEEVVHVAGDELAELVDEPAEPGAAEERDEGARERRQIRDREDDRDRHHQRAPDRVRDVQRAVAELRVAGEDEEEPVPEHRADRAHEKRVEPLRDVDAAEREPRDVPPTLHRASVTRPTSHRRRLRFAAAMDEFSLEGRTALVTGASRGIGAAIAAALDGAGARVALSGRDLRAARPRRGGSHARPVVLPAELGDVEAPTNSPTRRSARSDASTSS